MGIESATDTSDGELSVLDSACERGAHDIVTMLVEQRIALLDTATRKLRPTPFVDGLHLIAGMRASDRGPAP
jgi:hypothetical protein